jgi:hypothetical protein
MPWRKFTPKTEKVSGAWRTLHREELLKPYATANVTARNFWVSRLYPSSGV